MCGLHYYHYYVVFFNFQVQYAMVPYRNEVTNIQLIYTLQVENLYCNIFKVRRWPVSLTLGHCMVKSRGTTAPRHGTSSYQVWPTFNLQAIKKLIMNTVTVLVSYLIFFTNYRKTEDIGILSYFLHQLQENRRHAQLCWVLRSSLSSWLDVQLTLTSLSTALRHSLWPLTSPRGPATFQTSSPCRSTTPWRLTTWCLPPCTPQSRWTSSF